MTNYLIAPSILSADLARLGEESVRVIQAGADVIHFDVMDNHYVPNLTFGPNVCQALRNYGIAAPIDVHLMTKPVDRLIGDFIRAGASQISFHPEASEHVHRSVHLIKSAGLRAGLALNPSTPLNVLNYLLDDIDFVLLMTVNPGFGGQSLIENSLKKIQELHQWLLERDKKTIDIAVDGGITLNNIQKVARAGANFFVAGSAIFNSPDYQVTLKTMREQLNEISS